MAKLGIVNRLPIRVSRSVINGVPAGAIFVYAIHGTEFSEGQGSMRYPRGSLATPRGIDVGA